MAVVLAGDGDAAGAAAAISHVALYGVVCGGEGEVMG